MINRLIDCLCHPSRIGLYYKDKMYVVILHIIMLATLLFGFMAISILSQDYFGNSVSDNVSTLVIGSNEDVDIIYENNKLSGTEFSIEAEDYKAYFFKSNFKKEANILTMCFEIEEVKIYYGSEHLSTYKYTSSSAGSFNLANVKKGVMKDTIEFETLIDGAFNSVNSRFTTMEFMQTLSTIILTYIAIMFFGVLYTYFVNPTIGFKIRLKLALYCSFSFFIVMLFSVLFGINWLQYVAFVLPLVYMNITFSHIVRVNVKKN